MSKIGVDRQRAVRQQIETGQRELATTNDLIQLATENIGTIQTRGGELRGKLADLMANANTAIGHSVEDLNCIMREQLGARETDLLKMEISPHGLPSIANEGEVVTSMAGLVFRARQSARVVTEQVAGITSTMKRNQEAKSALASRIEREYQAADKEVREHSKGWLYRAVTWIGVPTLCGVAAHAAAIYTNSFLEVSQRLVSLSPSAPFLVGGALAIGAGVAYTCLRISKNVIRIPSYILQVKKAIGEMKSQSSGMEKKIDTSEIAIQDTTVKEGLMALREQAISGQEMKLKGAAKLSFVLPLLFSSGSQLRMVVRRAYMARALSGVREFVKNGADKLSQVEASGKELQEQVSVRSENTEAAQKKFMAICGEMVAQYGLEVERLSSDCKDVQNKEARENQERQRLEERKTQIEVRLAELAKEEETLKAAKEKSSTSPGENPGQGDVGISGEGI